MQLRSILNSEMFIINPNGDPNCSHYIEITTDDEYPIFRVNYCCDDEWVWEFVYSKTNYEIVKHIIMDCIFTCDNMEDLIDDLDDVFETECNDMIFDGIEVVDDEETCDGDCEHCEYIME